jgi:glutamine amidotransferase
MPSLGVVDYGMGNLRSVQKGLQYAGAEADLCSEPERLSGYQGLVLPGVGAFGDAMDNLRSRGMVEALQEYIFSGRQMLGICLGLQLLFEYSEEHGWNEGLGVIPGGVTRLPDTDKVPHMGWNVLKTRQDVPLFKGLPEGSMFYFVHSFYCQPADEEFITGTTVYGLEFACAARNGNVWGVQFHPEKSSTLGLRILKNFTEMVAEGR